MLPSSSSFYVTLTSDPTKEFPDNTPTSFKNRLPFTLRLHSYWRMGMMSITLSDPQQPPILSTAATTLKMAQIGWWQIRNNNGEYAEVKIQKSDLIERFGSTLTPSLLLHALVDIYTETKLEKRKSGTIYQAKDDQNPNPVLKNILIDTAVTFRWTPEGDLLMDNSKTSPYTYHPDITLSVALAKAMGWLIQHDKGTPYTLGKNIEEIPFTGSARGPQDIIDIKRVATQEGKKVSLGGQNWFVRDDTEMILGVAVNWKFLLHSTTEHHNSKMMFVYSSAVQSSIYNHTVVNLLSEVLYKKEGEGTTYFEPTTIRYLPLRSLFMESIETRIEDSTGKQPTNFTGPSTIITLHFTRDLP